jgi:predicted alpha-1,6-mannanase (GH76 family)
MLPIRPVLRLRTVVLCAFIAASPSASVVSGASESAPLGHAAKNPYLEDAGLGAQKLQSWYDPKTGLWKTTNWWNAANATTVLVNYSVMSGSMDYQHAIENTFRLNSARGFLNHYYDDEGWWALAWIDAYDWTWNGDYLNMARSIFDDMAAGWDGVCGGGIWWSKDRTYKNAIANELFLSVAAHLAKRVTDPKARASYAAWATREWEWFLKSGMINRDHLINDGLTKDGSCRNNGQITWTYNQGVILGGLVELYQENQDPSLARAAQEIALAAIHHLSDADGILHERCEPNCGGDGIQFKGIFMRNLMALNKAFRDDRYVQFARANADSIWSQDQGPDHEFGLVWSGPFSPDRHRAASQTSALDAIIAAAEMTSTASAIQRPLWWPRSFRFWSTTSGPAPGSIP